MARCTALWVAGATLFLFMLTSHIQCLNIAGKTVHAKDFATIWERMYYFSDFETNPSAALEFCSDLNMTLVAFEQEEESLSVREYITSTLLSGAAPFLTSGLVYDARWLWSGTGVEFSDMFHHWAPDEPTIMFWTRQTVITLTAQEGWATVYPNISERFICEQPGPQCHRPLQNQQLKLVEEKLGIESTNDGVISEKELVTIDGRQYFFSINDTWDGSQALWLCDRQRMNLAVLETEQENLAVANYIQSNFGPDILYRTSGIKYEDSWLWSGNGRAVAETRWAAGHPWTNTTSFDQRAILIGGDGLWRDGMNGEFFEFICEQRDPCN